jgi:hypothetical protein
VAKLALQSAHRNVARRMQNAARQVHPARIAKTPLARKPAAKAANARLPQRVKASAKVTPNVPKEQPALKANSKPLTLKPDAAKNK